MYIIYIYSELREWRKTIHQAATQDSPSAALAAHSRVGWGWGGGGGHGKMMRMYGRDVPHPYDMRHHEFPAEILKSQCPSLVYNFFFYAPPRQKV